MKKILVFVFLILSIQFLSAVEFDMKANYSQGETLIAKFSANFVDSVTEDNVLFYREPNNARASIEPHLTKIGKEYYLYARLPEKEANYSLRLVDVKYMKGTQVIDEDVVKNFTITNRTADFWVDPGVITTAGEFSLQMQNLNEKSIDITLSIKTKTGDQGNFSSSDLGNFQEGENKSLSMITGEIEKIDFEARDVLEDSLKTITLSSANTTYEIPLYVLSTPVSNKKEKNMQFSSKELQITIPTGEELVKTITLKNVGNEDLENITISFSEELTPYLEIPVTEISLLEAGEETEVGLYFSNSVDEKVIEGQIKAQSASAITSYSAITLIYLRDYELSDSEIESSVIKTCSEMGGKVCDEGASCSGDTSYAKDGICCEGICTEPPEKKSYGWLGWLMLILIIGFLVWFFFRKYRGVKGTPKFPFGKRPSPPNVPASPKKLMIRQPPKSIPPERKTNTEEYKELEKDAMQRLQEFKKKFEKK